MLKFSEEKIKQISKDYNISSEFATTITNVVSDLKNKGIQYRIIGGLAVGVHSVPRTTQDVDFYVSSKDIEKIKSMYPDHTELDLDGKWDGVSANIDGIDIDFIYTENSSKALMKDPGTTSNELSFLSLVELIYTKILASRLKDQNDIATLVQYYSGDTSALEDEVAAKIKKYPVKHEREEYLETLNMAFIIGNMQKNKKSAKLEINKVMKKMAAKYGSKF